MNTYIFINCVSLTRKMVIFMTLKQTMESRMKDAFDGKTQMESCLNEMVSLIDGLSLGHYIDTTESGRIEWDVLEDLDELLSSESTPEAVRSAAFRCREKFFRTEFRFYADEKNQNQDPYRSFLTLLDIYKGERTSPALKEPSGRAMLKIVDTWVVRGSGELPNHSELFKVMEHMWGRVVPHNFILGALLEIATDEQSPIRSEARKALADVIVLSPVTFGYLTSSMPAALNEVKGDIIEKAKGNLDSRFLRFIAGYESYNIDYCELSDAVRTEFGVALAEVLLKRLDLDGLKKMSECKGFTEQAREAARANLDPAVIGAEKGRQRQEKIKRMKAGLERASKSGTINEIYCLSKKLSEELGDSNPERMALATAVGICWIRRDVKSLASFLGRNPQDDRFVMSTLHNLVTEVMEASRTTPKAPGIACEEPVGGLPLPAQFRCRPHQQSGCDTTKRPLSGCVSGRA
jgi:hypothetical protein